MRDGPDAMAPRKEDARWVVLTMVSLGVVAGCLFLVRTPRPGSAVQEGRKPQVPVQMARPTGGDQILKDEALIRDLRPLFLPTEFNSTLPEPRREPGRTILDEERARWNFAEGELALNRDLPAVAVLNRKAAERAGAGDVLESSEVGLGATGFGRGRREVEAMAERGGFLEVTAVATGQRVLWEELPAGAGPGGGKPWEPMELFAAVDAAGLAAPLVVTEGSRVDEVDTHFRKFLAQGYRLGERLPPGFYRVVVGP